LVSSAVSVIQIENDKIAGMTNNNYKEAPSLDDYVNLTVEEVWEFISNSSNGIQILIDVRTPQEYFDERIYTQSFLEKPRLFPLQIMQRDGLLLRLFMIFYKDREVILYCRSANRSFIATQILIDHGFSGTIYNMMGGITEWKQAGLPTI
jgi:rhodanese-related sulfurtransferase